MRILIVSCALAFALALASGEADAAKRFGGGGNLGKQRPAPTQNQAAPAPAQPPAQQAAPASPAAAPGAAGAAAAAKPTFMSRWGGLLAGLGIGVLLASLFGAELGPIIGLLLAGLLAVAVIALLFRFLGARRGQPATAAATAAAPGFSGIGSRAQPSSMEFRGSGATDAPAAAGDTAAAPAHQPSFEKEAFLRVAKTSFIRLQAANDAGDLDDIRDFTTPEVYSEVAMQVKERGGKPQRTEVLDLHAELVNTVVEGDYEIASVRFYGLIREDDARSSESFDETWHVRKDRRDRRAPWLIAGIQQAA